MEGIVADGSIAQGNLSKGNIAGGNPAPQTAHARAPGGSLQKLVRRRSTIAFFMCTPLLAVMDSG